MSGRGIYTVSWILLNNLSGFLPIFGEYALTRSRVLCILRMMRSDDGRAFYMFRIKQLNFAIGLVRILLDAPEEWQGPYANQVNLSFRATEPLSDCWVKKIDVFKDLGVPPDNSRQRSKVP
jgi:hypothetical protein